MTCNWTCSDRASASASTDLWHHINVLLLFLLTGTSPICCVQMLQSSLWVFIILLLSSKTLFCRWLATSMQILRSAWALFNGTRTELLFQVSHSNNSLSLRPAISWTGVKHQDGTSIDIRCLRHFLHNLQFFIGSFSDTLLESVHVYFFYFRIFCTCGKLIKIKKAEKLT